MGLHRFTIAGLAVLILSAQALADDNYHRLVLEHKYKAAAALLQKSASAGKPLAQYRLAVLYRLGLGVKRDDKKALELLAQSAKRGNVDAAVLIRALSDVKETKIFADVESSHLKAIPSVPLQAVTHVGEPVAKLPSWAILYQARRLPPQPGLTGRVEHPEPRAATGETPLLVAARLASNQQAARLLNEKADATAADKRGWTAWMWGARNGDVELLKTLLNHSPPIRGAEQSVAVKMAIAYCQRPAAEVLIKAGVDAGADSDTALTNALASGTCNQWEALAPRILELRGLSKDQIPAQIDKLRREASGLRFPSDYSPLHVAAVSADARGLQRLLDQGADPNQLTNDQSNALMLSSAVGCAKCVEALVPMMTDINQKNSDGETALYLAVKSESVETVKLLLDAGASPDSRNLSRDTPAKLASKANDTEIIRLFGQ